TLNEARWIGERGWRVIVAGQPEGRFVTRAREAGLETAPLRMRSPWDLSAVARLTRLIRGERVSVVHTHSSVDGWLGGLAARAARGRDSRRCRPRDLAIPDRALPHRRAPGLSGRAAVVTRDRLGRDVPG